MISLCGPMPADAHLILNRTARSDVAAGKVPVITAADGCTVSDAAGTRYLDLVAGVTRPVHLGYGRRELAQAAYDQMVAMPYFTPLGYANEPALTLAARLAELVPGDISHFMFEGDGSEAVATAMKLVTMAKSLTSGYVPLGAVGCTTAVLEPVEMVEHVHTYANHPVGCATALKAIEIYQREALVARAADVGAYFLDRLQTLGRHPIVGQVRGIGLWTALDFTADKVSRALLPVARLPAIVSRARAAGLIIKAAPAGNAMESAPPLVIAREEIDRAVAILDACIAEEVRTMGL